MQTLDFHPVLVTPSESKWHVFREKTVTYSCMWATLLCSAQRATVCQAQARTHVMQQQWCNNNDRAPRPSLRLCLWHWLIETNRAQACSTASKMFLLRFWIVLCISYTCYNLVKSTVILLTQGLKVFGSFIQCSLISNNANKRQLKLTWSHRSKKLHRPLSIYQHIILLDQNLKSAQTTNSSRIWTQHCCIFLVLQTAGWSGITRSRCFSIPLFLLTHSESTAATAASSQAVARSLLVKSSLFSITLSH